MKKQLTLSQKLKSYSLLTVGVLASAAAVDAQVVYTDIIPDYEGNLWDEFAVDLNNDGITDLILSNDAASGGATTWYSVSVTPQPGNSVASLLSSPQVLDYGANINSNLQWNNGAHQVLGFFTFYNTAISYTAATSGNWLGVTEKYMGVRFTFDSEQHYGWIRLSVDSKAEVTVYDYAFEATANTPIVAGVKDCVAYYFDADGDGFGDESSSGDTLCSSPGASYSIFNTDCDDADAAMNPSTAEICNGVDENCNGSIDEGVALILHPDVDGDGYGAVAASIQACSPQNGYVLDSTDCDDDNATIHPAVPLLQWKKYMGGSKDDYGYSTQQTTDGGFIIAGYTYSIDGDISGNHGGSDYWILKLDSSGNIEWQKCLGGSFYDFAHSIQQTTDGGFVVAGYSYSNSGDVSGNHGGGDYWIAKLDISGNLEWQKCLGGSSFDNANSIQQTADGGFIIAGYSNSNDGNVSGNHGGNDYWVVKLDASGNLEWQKCLGGSSYDYANSIQQTTDGGFIIAGYSDSNDGDVSGNHGNNDYWVVKLDASGNLEWEKCLGGIDNDYAGSVRQTTDGGFIVAGSSYSNDGDVSGNHGSRDYWIAKLDTSGNLEWQKCLGGSSYDYANSIQQTTDGGFIIAGYSDSNDGDVSGNHGNYDYWFVKLNSSGNSSWEKSLGGSSSDLGLSIQQTTDGGFVVAGYSYSTDGEVSGNHGNPLNPSADYWIVKLTIFPGGIETCNGIDDNCSGTIDEEVAVTYYTDADGDTYGDLFDTGTSLCSDPGFGYSTNNNDCDDNNASANPAATEVCNSIDDNCDGSIDEGVLVTFYADADGDNYGTSTSSVQACSQPNGYVADNTDCDDNNAAVNPSATEVCDNIDNNCDGNIDEGLLLTFYADADDDNYGDANISTLACTLPNGYVTDNTDCDDNNASVNPAVTEICNDIDDNCNGSVDDGLVFTTYYADADGDNYGDANNSIDACASVSGYITDSTDCDDSNPIVNPSATEICNNTDDDCNGSIDDGLIFITYYADADSDTYGDATNSVDACSPVSGYITDNTDCDDSNPNVNPGAVEISNNGIDDNCNGDIDEFGVGVSSIDVNANQLSIFPNPTDGTFTLLLNLSEEANSEAKIEVLNMLGQIIISEKAKLDKGKLQKEIQLSDAAAEGMYLVKVTINDSRQSRDGQVFTSQINFQK